MNENQFKNGENKLEVQTLIKKLMKGIDKGEQQNYNKQQKLSEGEGKKLHKGINTRKSITALISDHFYLNEICDIKGFQFAEKEINDSQLKIQNTMQIKKEQNKIQREFLQILFD